MIYREKDFGPTLCHFNKNHDPRNGRFAKKGAATVVGGGVAGAIAGAVVKSKSRKIIRNAELYGSRLDPINKVIKNRLNKKASAMIPPGWSFDPSKDVAPFEEAYDRARSELSNELTIIAAGSAAVASSLAIIGGKKQTKQTKQRGRKS